MLRMLADAIDELIRLKFANANIVNCRKQWESNQIQSSKIIGIFFQWNKISLVNWKYLLFLHFFGD